MNANELKNEISNISVLEGKQTIASLTEKLNEIIEFVNANQAIANTSKRDRGPASERAMTDEDALRILSGDLRDASHKSAAETLGLSYGQIYSARGGYTFKKVHKQIREQAESNIENDE